MGRREEQGEKKKKKISSWILCCIKCKKIIAVNCNLTEAIITSASELEREVFIAVLENEGINSLVW